jgi:hypothetical protein
MWLQLLAFWHTTSIYLASVWDAAKTKARDWLGPAPQNFYLLQDGRVLPSSVPLPSTLTATTHLYDPRTHKMTAVTNTDPDARHRRLNIIAANFSHADTGPVDISDWVGEIRAFPVPELPVRQLLTLWALVHNQYVPLSGGAQVNVTKNDGETDLITLE